MHLRQQGRWNCENAGQDTSGCDPDTLPRQGSHRSILLVRSGQRTKQVTRRLYEVWERRVIRPLARTAAHARDESEVQSFTARTMIRMAAIARTMRINR